MQALYALEVITQLRGRNRQVSASQGQAKVSVDSKEFDSNLVDSLNTLTFQITVRVARPHVGLLAGKGRNIM